MANTKVVKTNRNIGQINGLSTSDSMTLEQMFPASPVSSIDVAAQMKLLVDGVVNGNTSTGLIDLDYSGKGVAEAAPAISEFVPSPGSPGPGSIDPHDKPPVPDNWPPPSSNMGSQTAPKDTSSNIASQVPKEHP